MGEEPEKVTEESWACIKTSVFFKSTGTARICSETDHACSLIWCHAPSKLALDAGTVQKRCPRTIRPATRMARQLATCGTLPETGTSLL